MSRSVRQAPTAPPTPRRWHPAPIFWVSAAVHAGAATAWALWPQAWPWALAAVVGNHLVLGGAGLWPRSRLLGPNLVRLPQAAAVRREICITFDDGPDPDVTPRVLDMLDEFGAKASFFCIAERAAAHPGIARQIVARGHSVENHSRRHSTAFGWYGWRRLRREIESAQHILTAAAGRPPRFFRAPFGMRNPLLEPVLARSGLQLASWSRRGYDTVRRDSVQVSRRLATGLAAGDVLLLHDGNCARTRYDGHPLVLAVLPDLLQRVADAGLHAVTLCAALRDGPEL